jgi:DNA-binding response OmpR family regulator
MKRILWVDDEIELLRPFILLLEERGYSVTGIHTGDDAIQLLKKFPLDLILLDEIMPGKDGLATLREIREINEDIPVVMVTKSEEEELIDKVYAKLATDYLAKPIKFQQLISTVKRILEREEMVKRHISEDYSGFYNQVNGRIQEELNVQDWVRVYLDLVRWSIRLDNIGDETFKETHEELIMLAEREFARFVEERYTEWVELGGVDLSVNIVEKYVIPIIEREKKVYFVILDCMRYDQWLLIKPFLEKYYRIEEHQYFSILPTATPFARNSIFSGLYPSDISQLYPRLWDPEQNRFEKELLSMQTERIRTMKSPVYIKVRNVNEAKLLRGKLLAFKKARFVSIVINFLDILIHQRMQSEVIEEVLPEQGSLRNLSRLWFKESHIYHAMKEISKGRATIILTTDHGSLIARKPTLIHGGKVISKNLRYKYGPVVRANPRHCMFITEPRKYGLPDDGLRYAIAKEDYYFIYSSHPEQYEREYKNTFQHGGISMQEMILPIAILTPR